MASRSKRRRPQVEARREKAAAADTVERMLWDQRMADRARQKHTDFARTYGMGMNMQNLQRRPMPFDGKLHGTIDIDTSELEKSLAAAITGINNLKVLP
jgi:hypothetical protein